MQDIGASRRIIEAVGIRGVAWAKGEGGEWRRGPSTPVEGGRSSRESRDEARANARGDGSGSGGVESSGERGDNTLSREAGRGRERRGGMEGERGGAKAEWRRGRRRSDMRWQGTQRGREGGRGEGKMGRRRGRRERGERGGEITDREDEREGERAGGEGEGERGGRTVRRRERGGGGEEGVRGGGRGRRRGGGAPFDTASELHKGARETSNPETRGFGGKTTRLDRQVVCAGPTSSNRASGLFRRIHIEEILVNQDPGRHRDIHTSGLDRIRCRTRTGPRIDHMSPDRESTIVQLRNRSASLPHSHLLFLPSQIIAIVQGTC